MHRTYAARPLPAWSCDDGPIAQHRQENAKALRVAQNFELPKALWFKKTKLASGQDQDPRPKFLSQFYLLPMPFLSRF